MGPSRLCKLAGLLWLAASCQQAGAPCETTANCLAREVCVDEQCRAACASGQDCADVERCVEGACQPVASADASTEAGSVDGSAIDRRRADASVWTDVAALDGTTEGSGLNEASATDHSTVLDAARPDIHVGDASATDRMALDAARPDGVGADQQVTDTSRPDTNRPDTNRPDTNRPDTNQPDTNRPDTNRPDTNQPDTNQPDTNRPDTNRPDTNRPDANQPDTNRPDATPADWWDPAWPARIPITVHASSASGSHADFALLVTLTSDNFDYSVGPNNGRDLRFVIPGSQTALAHEFDVWELGGTSTIWVRYPLLDGNGGDQIIWLYYGNNNATWSNTGSVWSTAHIGVWHLQESNPGGNNVVHRDATTHGHDGVGYGNMPQTAVIGLGQSLDGDDDYIELPPALVANLADFTFSAWVWFAGRSNYERIFDFGDGVATGSSGQYMYLSPMVQSTDLAIYSMTLAGYNNSTSMFSTTLFPQGRWAYVAVTLRNSIVRLYVDGALDSELAGFPLEPRDLGAVRNWLGRSQYLGDLNLLGSLDEVRLEQVARDDDWIMAQYLNMTGALTELGAAESL